MKCPKCGYNIIQRESGLMNLTWKKVNQELSSKILNIVLTAYIRLWPMKNEFVGV